MSLENYFQEFKKNIIGNEQIVNTPFGKRNIVYTDWTASGRLYRPIEERLIESIGPFCANTHSESSATGSFMTQAYSTAKKIIKKHVNASEEDVLIMSNSGMTGVINKFQRILGLKIHENFRNQISIRTEDRPVIFVTHMEHHSNQTTWLETICDLEIVPPDENGLVSVEEFDKVVRKYFNRKTKIAAITSCSNVTGIRTPYHEIAELMHKYAGLCFVDFACSAPYIDINMHPENKLAKLDAIYFSPHKFLGGPGTPGALLFDGSLYKITVPDQPGGGTVDWTNPWGEHKYIEDIETREDGGTPSFLPTMKFALCCKLKDEMGVDNILKREHELLELIWDVFYKIPNLHILASNIKERLGVISFYIDDLHYNLGVKLLNDRFGIQVRGGCSCAGTYGHYLLHVSHHQSNAITEKINSGDLSAKPGWIRLSIHPTMTDEEMKFVVNAVKEVAENFQEWGRDYKYNKYTNEFKYKYEDNISQGKTINSWFENKL